MQWLGGALNSIAKALSCIELKCKAEQWQRKDRSCIDGKGIEMICNAMALRRYAMISRIFYKEKEFNTWKRYT